MCWRGVRLEYIDPVEGAGGGLPHTTDPALPDDAKRSDADRAGRAFRWKFPHGGARGHENPIRPCRNCSDKQAIADVLQRYARTLDWLDDAG